MNSHWSLTRTGYVVTDSLFEGGYCDDVLQGCGPGRVLVSLQTLLRGPVDQQDTLGLLVGRSLQVGQHQARDLGALHSNSKSSQTCYRCWIKEVQLHLKTWTCLIQALSSTDLTCVTRFWRGLIIWLLHSHL